MSSIHSLLNKTNNERTLAKLIGMFKERTFVIVLFCAVLTVSTIVLQFLNPTQGFLDGGLIAAILLTIWVKEDIYTQIFGSISFLSILIASFYPNDNASRWQIVLEHLFPAIIVVITTFSVLYIKRIYLSMESDERQLNALFEHATEGIILTDKDGKIVLVNPAVLALFKYESKEMIGSPIEMLIPQRFHQHHGHYREGFYQKPSNRTMGHGRDLFGVRKDGLELPVEISLSYYKQKGEFFVIAFVVDITQRKKSEAILLEQKNKLELVTSTIKKLNIELEDKVEQRTLILKEALQQLEVSQQELSEALQKEKDLNEIKSRFVSMASHEFRTPLSTVLSSASLIGRYTKDEEQPNRDKHIKKIKESVKHLNELLEDFLSLGKLEEGRVEADIVSFDVREFAEEVLDELGAVKNPNQSIDLQYRGEYNFITDKRLLKNIFLNLISNAIKFSGDNGNMKVTIINKNNVLQTIVEDAGIGISKEDQEHLFSSFYRGRNAVNIQGTGLGLHIVKRYIDILQGTISLESELGKGTTVCVELPKLEAS